MKFISANFGQVLYQVPMDEIRPTSGFDYISTVQAMIERYRFVEPPPDLKDIAEKGIIFKNGAMQRDKNLPIQIVSLGIYNDGVLLTAVNTDDAELVINDFVGWATQKFGFRQPVSLPHLTYSSQVVVEFDRSIDGLIVGFPKIVNLLNASLSKCGGGEFDLHVARLAISADPHIVRFPAQSAFYIEPRGGVPYTARRYFSGAPLTTPLHLELLAEIEELI